MKQVPYRLAEALEILCTRKSLEHITVSQIAAAAGVTRQVFYRYFDDKFELASWIHHVHLYQSLKLALEEDSRQVWYLTTRNWLSRLNENKVFYMNAFQSVSQKEFQRIIRDFFYTAYKWQMEQSLRREITEEEAFGLRTYLYGGMESIYQWIASGMSMPVARLVDLLRCAMPEIIRNGVLTGENVTYQEALNQLETYLLEEGLLLAIK